MTAVVFETPGLIDLRAFTIMGAHAKPNASNPIGFFGTGLKYAIAVAVRLGDEPVVWVGRDKLTFSKRSGKFRGTDLETIRMSVLKDGNKRPTHYELPFTTRYGARWEPWMAFRELESNTRDEGGTTYIVEGGMPDAAPSGGRTLMVFSAPEIVEAARAIDAIFLPRARRSGTLLEALDPDDRPLAEDADFVFYRTMRAMKIDKPSIYTYNVLEALQLTEDRTIAYTFQVRDILARWVLTEATEEQVEAIVTAGDEWWEHGLEYPGHVKPSEAFKAVMLRRPKGVSSYAWAYWGGYKSPAPRRVARSFNLFEHFPKPWTVSGDVVVADGGDIVFERPDNMSSWVWDETAAAIVRRLEAGDSTAGAESDDEEEEAEPAEPLDPEDAAPEYEPEFP